MTIITFTTDFGQSDYDAGVLAGVALGIAPQARIVPLTHDIPRHDVLAGALLLGRSAPYFPPGTVHVAVVDPGVGTKRRGLAAHLGTQFFVGPDNGLLTLLYHQAIEKGGSIEIVHLTQPRYWLPKVSAIFHGRDVFAPVAAHIANGVSLDELGTFIQDPVLLDIPQVQPFEGGVRGAVQHVDAFGNLATNIEPRHLSGPAAEARVRIAGREIHGILRAFGDALPGELVALFDSSGRLSVCVVNGSAAEVLGVGVGEKVELS
jgi:S-adenosyl-L-methionine hydrolase (adenosine-forming)